MDQLLRNARIGWGVAAALAVAVVILLGLIWKMQYDLSHDLDYVLDQNGDQIMEVRAQIADQCSGPNPLASAECQASLDALADVLRDAGYRDAESGIDPDRCEVQVSYAIGVAEPTSISVNTFGTGKVSDEVIVGLIGKHFDLRPYGIIKMLDLIHPMYQHTAAYGHFGRKPHKVTYKDGAGKTALVNLVARFYDATGGRVLLDGVDVRDYSIDRLQALVGVTLQEAVLFEGDLRMNLKFASPEASDDVMIDAATVSARVKELGAQIAKDYAGKPLTLRVLIQ